MSLIKLKHSGGNGVIIAAPSSNPAADRTITLPSNADGTMLTTTNPKSGNIIQVVSVSDTIRESVGTISVSSSYVDTPFTVDITPASTSSKILISGFFMGEPASNEHQLMFAVKRAISGGATTTIEGASSGSRSTCISVPNQGYFADNNDSTPFNISFNGLLDSPSTTSAVTYTMVVKTPSATFNLNYNKTVADTDNASHERGLSWITVMEVAG